MDKDTLRALMRQKKCMLTEEQIASASRRLTEQFLALDAYRRCRSLYAYCSFNQEVRTGEILRRALADGKALALPRVCGRELRFVAVRDLAALAPGAMGIPEPPDEPAAGDERALILMPGLAFDKSGHRVGYGGGYYDRYLARHPLHTLIALCYDFQLVDAIDRAEHDVPVHQVIACPV